MNPFGIALATLAAFLIGFALFNGKTLYPVWYRAMGKEVPARPEVMTDADKREAGVMFGATFASQIGQAIVMSWLIDVCHRAYGGMNPLTGALVGLVVGVGISGFSSLSHRLFSGQGFKVWAIEIFGDVVALVAMGAILGAFYLS